MYPRANGGRIGPSELQMACRKRTEEQAVSSVGKARLQPPSSPFVFHYIFARNSVERLTVLPPPPRTGTRDTGEE